MRPISTIAADSTAAQVWKISVSHNVQFLLAHHASILSKEELDKSDSFLQKKDRASYLTRRIMIRLLLAKSLGCPACEIQFKEGKNKKPVIDYPKAGIHFNISHSGDCILIGLANSPIGIDVEKIDPLFNFRDIISHYFTPEEQAFILANEQEASNRFFYLWTRKEAYVKYTAEGLLGDLMGLPNLIDQAGCNGTRNPSFTAESSQVDDAYYMSIVYPTSVSEVQYFEYTCASTSYFPFPSEV